jgi:hypothetical protein
MTQTSETKTAPKKVRDYRKIFVRDSLIRPGVPATPLFRKEVYDDLPEATILASDIAGMPELWEHLSERVPKDQAETPADNATLSFDSEIFWVEEFSDGSTRQTVVQRFSFLATGSQPYALADGMTTLFHPMSTTDY